MLMINFKISEDVLFIRIRRIVRNVFYGLECFFLGWGIKVFFGDFDMNLDFRKVMGGEGLDLCLLFFENLNLY